MEKLTYEQVLERTEKLKTSKIYATKEEYFTIDEIIQPMVELQTYKKLEEQIGCPIEVYVKLKYDTNFFDRDGIEWFVEAISKKNIICATRFNISTSPMKAEYKYFELKDYKKTWWIKEDKSE